MKQIEILIDSGLSVNARDNNGLSLLHHAALENQIDIVAFLLERYFPFFVNTEARATQYWIAIGVK